MTIRELAIEIGKAIKADERMIRLNAAREAYEANEELGSALMEYEIQQRALADVYTKAERDENLIAAVQQRIDVLYEKITSSPEYKEMLAAEEAVNALMNEVNTTITTEITGEEPCTHDCSSCGRHCHG
jgi:cell fate (sporulation/competence/biofilm development) regulator YlbF (YheA/YmcA/DUF963 family)